MAVSRLLRFPVTLISRVDDGLEDEWGSPVATEKATEALCYYRQLETDDQDDGAEGAPTSETIEVFLEPTTDPGPYDAVRLDVGRGVEQFEVVGQPAAELNARTAKANHLRMKVKRSQP